MTVTVRDEATGDAATVRAVVTAVFDQAAEADLDERLRAGRHSNDGEPSSPSATPPFESIAGVSGPE